MIVIVLSFCIPILFVVTCIIFLFKPKSKWKRASLYGILAFGLFFLISGYSILQSRSSTAGIGFIFLPIIALLPASIGFFLGKTHTEYLWRKQNNTSRSIQRVGLIILPVLLILPFIWQMSVLQNTISKNNSRDIESARQREAIKSNTKKLDLLLSKNHGREAVILMEKAGATEDRTELIPIANNKYTSAETLNKLSRSTDRGVVLSAVRNRNVAESTLEWVYKNYANTSYFYADLSFNPKTPKEILRELYDKRLQNTGIARQLARNPKLPEDVLNDLVSEPRKYVLRNILDRPDINCKQVNKVLITIEEQKGTNIYSLKGMANAKLKECSSLGGPLGQ